jgi:hypothetical protein
MDLENTKKKIETNLELIYSEYEKSAQEKKQVSSFYNIFLRLKMNLRILKKQIQN